MSSENAITGQIPDSDILQRAVTIMATTPGELSTPSPPHTNTSSHSHPITGASPEQTTTTIIIVVIVVLVVVVLAVIAIMLVSGALYWRKHKRPQTEETHEYDIVGTVPPPLPQPRVQLGENVAYHHAAMASHTDEGSAYEAVDKYEVPTAENIAYETADRSAEYGVPTADYIAYDSVDRPAEYEVPTVQNIAYEKSRAVMP